MAKASILNALYNKKSSPLEFKFDSLTAPPLLSLLTPQDIYELNRIARSVRLSGKIKEKYKMIDDIMTTRGFVKLHAGTNRVVYRFLEDQRFVAKIAVDKVGLGDNPAEFKNQFLLKPFVTRVFEVSPCGTVAIVERVDAVMSREEFASIADDIFHIITKIFVGKYVLEDFGCEYFMNWAVRPGWGPVLLDFPYVYELDGNKLYCNAPVIPGRKDITCGGELDYDDGFNNLICTKCGKHYHARELKKAEEDKLIIVGGKKTMKVRVMVGNEVIKDSSANRVARVIDPEPEIKVTIPEVEKPKESIFNKTEIKEAIEFTDQVKELKEYLETNTVEEEEVSESEEIESEESDEYYEEDSNSYDDDGEDYESYLNNKTRNKIKKENKFNRRNSNTNFTDF